MFMPEDMHHGLEMQNISLEQAMASCPFLGKMAMEDVQLLLSIVEEPNAPLDEVANALKPTEIDRDVTVTVQAIEVLPKATESLLQSPAQVESVTMASPEVVAHTEEELLALAVDQLETDNLVLASDDMDGLPTTEVIQDRELLVIDEAVDKLESKIGIVGTFDNRDVIEAIDITDIQDVEPVPHLAEENIDTLVISNDIESRLPRADTSALDTDYSDDALLSSEAVIDDSDSGEDREDVFFEAEEDPESDRGNLLGAVVSDDYKDDIQNMEQEAPFLDSVAERLIRNLGVSFDESSGANEMSQLDESVRPILQDIDSQIVGILQSISSDGSAELVSMAHHELELDSIYNAIQEVLEILGMQDIDGAELRDYIQLVILQTYKNEYLEQRVFTGVDSNLMDAELELSDQGTHEIKPQDLVSAQATLSAVVSDFRSAIARLVLSSLGVGYADHNQVVH